MPDRQDALKEGWEWDEEFLQSRREAWRVLWFFIAALAWVIPSALWLGYDRSGDDGMIDTVLGFPSWVLWSIALPWLIAAVATILFCLRRLAGRKEGPPERRSSSDEGA